MGMNIESLPDFDDMDTVVRVATTAKAKLETAKNDLASMIAAVIGQAMEDQKYWVNGKPPTAAYCESVLSVLGNDANQESQLRALRKEIVEQERTYQEAKLLLDNMKSRIAVWQTSSANGRKANL